MSKIQLYSEGLYGPQFHGEFGSREQVDAYVKNILPEHTIWWTLGDEYEEDDLVSLVRVGFKLDG